MKEYIIPDDFLDYETKASADGQGYLRELVRCGECKYWDRSDPFFFNGVVRCECKRHENEYWTADGFCSDAERNDSEVPNS